MPVADGIFTPNAPLVAAEQPVRWKAINRHILEQRARIEQETIGTARRVGFLIGSAITPAVQLRKLEARLGTLLMGTYTFGRDEARHELAALRARGSAPVSTARRPDVGPGAAGRRFDRLASRAAADVSAAASKVAGDGPVAASTAAAKALHLAVLESVGQALNLGRTHGAITAPGGPPAFAMRSEMLDKNLCDRCSELHGTIVQVESDDYYTLLPPASCLGGGRCRGVMVFADGVSDLRGPG